MTGGDKQKKSCDHPVQPAVIIFAHISQSRPDHIWPDIFAGLLW